MMPLQFRISLPPLRSERRLQRCVLLLPPSVQNGAVPPDGHHPPSWHQENHSAYLVWNLHRR
ncbi:TPA: hypothetical protein HL361_23985 [Escherichia coli]|nr:hypothetical protein [Escherichia coli]HAJ0095864.1 hypothetical protein [Escherichia coli]